MNKESKSFKTTKGEEEFYTAYEQSLTLWNFDYASIFIETTWGRTHLLTAGPKNGQPLLLIHGFGFGATMWYPNIEILAKTYKIYAVDVIGEFNKSDMYKSIQDRIDYVEWLDEVLNALNIPKISIIGHSNGGWHTLNFAMLREERVKRVVLLAPAASFIPFSKQFGIRLLLINLIKYRSFVTNFFGKWLLAKGNEVSELLFNQFYQGLIHFKWKHKILIPSVYNEEDLKKLAIPICLMVGDKEVIYNHHKLVNQIKNILPKAKTVVIKNAGHALSIEKADEVNRHLVEFLNERVSNEEDRKQV